MGTTSGKEPEPSFIGWLTNIVGKETFNNEIIKLLNDGLNGTITTQGILSYMEDNLFECSSSILKYIIDGNVDYHHRNRFFNLYIQIEGIYKDDLLKYLYLLKDGNHIDWKVLEFLMKQNPVVVSDWLIDNYNPKELPVNGVCLLLQETEPIKSLEIYKAELREELDFLSDVFYDDGNFLKSINVKKYNSNGLKDFFFSILTIFLLPSFNNNENGKSNDIFYVFDGLLKLIKKDADVSLLKDVKSFVESAKTQAYHAKSMQHVESGYQRFERESLIELDKGKSISKAIREVRRLSTELLTD